MEQVPYLDGTLTRWNVGNSTFLALPERGARLMHWHVTLGDGSVRDVIHWPDLKSIGDAVGARGGNPILFPFNARTFDNGDIHFWRDPSGVRRPMPMHGLARQGAFTVNWIDSRGFSATLVPDDQARAAYPFDYEFTVVYRFNPLGLSCEFILKNTGDQPIPWSAGHHFYFTMPWEDGKTRADYQIKIPASKTLRQSTQGKLIPGPALAPVESLANHDLIDTFHLGLKSNAVSLSSIAGGESGGTLTLHNGLEPVPPAGATFVTWTQDAEAPYYCVEPWMGPANAPETNVGLHWVAPGHSESYVVEVALS